MFTYMRHSCAREPGFKFEWPHGSGDYTFMHFFNSVDILVNGEIVTTEPNACVFFAPDDKQWYQSHGALIHDHLHGDGEMGKKIFEYNLKTEFIYYPPDTDFITELVKKIEFETLCSPENSRKMLFALADELFISFSRAVSNVEICKNHDNHELIKARNYILSHIKEDWKVDKMAERVNLSPSRFHALYKEIFGISPVNDLINTRINSAKHLLCNSSMTVYQIAEHLGYKNTFHFIRQFKKIAGEPPNSYRMKNRNKIN
ncbi:MAG: helix-turn-helix domain-containing protein [Acutalibacteraceae bacterium]